MDHRNINYIILRRKITHLIILFLFLISWFKFLFIRLRLFGCGCILWLRLLVIFGTSALARHIFNKHRSLYHNLWRSWKLDALITFASVFLSLSCIILLSLRLIYLPIFCRWRFNCLRIIHFGDFCSHCRFPLFVHRGGLFLKSFCYHLAPIIGKIVGVWRILWRLRYFFINIHSWRVLWSTHLLWINIHLFIFSMNFFVNVSTQFNIFVLY